MGSSKDRVACWIVSVVLALVFFIATRFLGAKATLLLVPIVSWMIWKQDIRWYPGLIFLLAIEGYGMYAYLVMSLIICFMNWRELNAYPRVVKRLLVFLLIPIPMLVALCVRNLGYLSDSPSAAFAPMTMYLSVFPFFFGVLIAKQMNKQDALMLIYSCILLMAMQFIAPPLAEEDGISTIRLIFLAIPVVVCSCAYVLTEWRDLTVVVLGTILILAYLFVGYGNTLTMIGSGLFSCVLLFFVKLRFKAVVRCINSFLPLIISLAFTTFVVANFEKYALQSYDKSLSYDDISNQWDWESIKTRLQIKTFDDRAALWRASWNSVSEPPYWVPDVVENGINLVSVTGAYSEGTSDMGAHNQPLQILRTLRWGLGSFLIMGYFMIVILGGRFLQLPLQKNEPMLPIIVATVTVAIVGFTTGHYPLLPTFSFMFTSFLGLGYGLYCREMQSGYRRGIQTILRPECQ